MAYTHEEYKNINKSRIFSIKGKSKAKSKALAKIIGHKTKHFSKHAGEPDDFSGASDGDR